MYSSFSNQIFNFGHFLIAFILVGVFWPRLIFAKEEGTALDSFFSSLSKMAALIIILVYVLVIIRLYELISLVSIVLIFSFYRHFTQKGWSIHGLRSKVNVLLYDFFDGILQPVRLLVDFLSRKKSDLIIGFYHALKVSNILNSIVFLGMFFYSAYLRFYDAFTHAAPNMSDAYVTLAWFKYIEQRILFHDGIYPQGFHIFLSVLHKFAAIDHLYVLKYTGPLNGLLITLSLYFFVSRITGNKWAGIAAATAYGVFGQFLSNDLERQAATNSQEFGFIFILPAWYFTYRYLKDPTTKKMYSAFIPILVTGLVHALAFTFVAIGVFVIVLTTLLVDARKKIMPAVRISMAGVVAGLISIVPAIIGLLMGKDFHGSTANYLVEIAKIEIIPPVLVLSDYMAMLGVLLYCLVCMINKPKKMYFELFFIFFLGFVSFFIYYYGGALTKSIVIASRSSELWSLVSAICIGLGWYSLNKLTCVTKLRNLETGLAFITFVILISIFHPSPIVPYKMERDVAIEQYYRISNELRPTEWMIISQEEGYGVVLNNGYHLMMKDFLEGYDPKGKRLIKWENGQASVLSSPDIFIFHEKNVYKVDRDIMEPIIARREKENQELADWIQEYKKNHQNLSVYYEDENLEVLRIHQPPDRKETKRKIWESEK